MKCIGAGSLEKAVGVGGWAGGLGRSLAARALDHVVCRDKCWAGSGQAGECMGGWASGWQGCPVHCMRLPRRSCPPRTNIPSRAGPTHSCR